MHHKRKRPRTMTILFEEWLLPRLGDRDVNWR